MEGLTDCRYVVAAIVVAEVGKLGILLGILRPPWPSGIMSPADLGMAFGWSGGKPVEHSWNSLLNPGMLYWLWRRRSFSAICCCNCAFNLCTSKLSLRGMVEVSMG
jgi:hypothetical protein